MEKYIFIGIGGGLGSMVRFYVSETVKRVWPQVGISWPIATFSVNILGGFLMGALMGLVLGAMRLSDDWRLILGVGFLGGYTTFSAFSYEIVQMIGARQIGLAIGYVLCSVIGAVLAVWLGLWLFERIAR